MDVHSPSVSLTEETARVDIRRAYGKLSIRRKRPGICRNPFGNQTIAFARQRMAIYRQRTGEAMVKRAEDSGLLFVEHFLATSGAPGIK